jgi:hypothetical protein
LYERTRRRFLGAMGLNATLLAGGHAGAAPELKADARPLEGAAADAPEAPAVAVPPAPPSPPLDRPRLPSCPRGDFCVDAPKQRPAKPAAGFATCELTVPAPNDRFRNRYVRFDKEATRAARKTSPKACCYQWTIPCPGGRALRDASGAPLATPLAATPEWQVASGAGAVADDARRAALAAHWAREASYEHASVASFARTTLELLALGAPPELVAETQAAGLDEVRHAQALYGLARAYGAEAAGPGPVATDRPLHRDAASFALATFDDACVGETIASLVARAAEGAAEDAAVAGILATIAEDEERHAELAWRTLAWALAKAGPGARARLSGRVERLERELACEGPSERPASAGDGLLADDVTGQIRRRALAEVVLPCARALVA